MAAKKNTDKPASPDGVDTAAGTAPAGGGKGGAKKKGKPAKAASPKGGAAKPPKQKKEKTPKVRDPEAAARLARTARRLLAPALCLLAVAIVAFWLVIAGIAGDPRVAGGVTLEGVPIGGLAPEALDAYLAERLPDPPADDVLVVSTNQWNTTVPFGSLGLAVDRAALRDAILAPGHHGGVPARLFERLALRRTPVDVAVPVRFDTGRVDALLQAACAAIDRPPTGARLEMSESAVTLTTGADGVAVDVPKLAARIRSALAARTTGSVYVPTRRLQPPALDAAVLAKAINRMPANASRGTDADGRPTILPSARGRRIDVAELAAIIETLEARSDRGAVTRTLPVVFTDPSVTEADLEASAGRKGGSFATMVPLAGDMNRNRATNIRLAAAAIDGTIIPAGGEFSFNTATGPRTETAGYVTAPIYADGRVLADIGGGVCQVSTTLLNALLEAGLEPVERHPHTFTVAYAAPGRDAAVSYGQIDLRVRNPHPFAVTIRTRIEDARLSADVLFPPEAQAASFRLYTRVLATEPAATDLIEDSSLPLGNRRVLEPGVDGMSVETWMQRYEGGNLVAERKLFESRYLPYTARILTGTRDPGGSSATGGLAVLPDRTAGGDDGQPTPEAAGFNGQDAG